MTTRNMILSDGSLWIESGKFYRENFCRHHSGIETVADFKATLRAGAYTDLGGYPLYFVTSDGAPLSFQAARDNARQIMESIRDRSRDGWRVIGCCINYEDPDLYCDHTGARIASAYAEPEDA